MKIIIADDSVTIQKIVGNMLTGMGYADILTADGGDVVIDLLGRHADVGLILLDWNMPVMNGLECLRSIRAGETTKKIPVVMVTSEAVRDRVVEAMQAGANSYLVKPFVPDKLRATIESVLK